MTIHRTKMRRVGTKPFPREMSGLKSGLAVAFGTIAEVGLPLMTDAAYDNNGK